MGEVQDSQGTKRVPSQNQRQRKEAESSEQMLLLSCLSAFNTIGDPSGTETPTESFQLLERNQENLPQAGPEFPLPVSLDFTKLSTQIIL